MMKRDNYKTKKPLVDKLAQMRQRVAELEKSEAEHKQAEEEVRESERRYRLLVEDARDVIWTVDMNMRPTYISPSITLLLGYSVEEAMALPMEAVYTPDSFENAMKVLAEELAIEERGQKDLYRSRTLELELNRKDGSRVPVEGRFTFMRGPDQQPIAILAIVRDITERKRAEEKLRESEREYRTFIESSHEVVFSKDRDGCYRTLNLNAAIGLGGSCIEDIEGKTDYDLLPKEQADALRQIDKQIMKSGKPVEVEEVVRDAKGENRIYLSYKWPTYDDKGRISGISCFATDVTEHRRAEEALRESEEKYRKIVGNVYDMVYSLYPDGTLYFISPNVLSFTGYKPEEGIGHNIMEFIHPDDREHVLADFEKTIKTGKEFPTIFRFSRKDGSYFYAEELGRVIREGGKIVGVTGVVRDITERMKMEEALRESEEKLQRMFESATDGIVVTDLNGNIMEVNEAAVRLRGSDSKEKIIGQSAFESIAERDRVRVMKILESAKEDGQIRRNVEITFLTEDGREYFAEVSSALLRDAAGNSTGFIAILRDITERKKMEEQLIVADRLASIGELSSGLAHEINNPLTGIILLSELLLAKDLPDDVREDLKVLNRELQRTAGIVRNLLTFAREHETEKQAVNINSIIEEVLELRAYEQKVNNIKVNTRLTPALPEIMADGFRLQQVFINIIINAEHFMIEAHNKGTLTIATERVGKVVRASFVDDGPGIAPENLGHLFDPFFTTKEVGKGTGLGLSICHGIVTEHGGRIYAESKLGKGATFVVELPVGGQ